MLAVDTLLATPEVTVHDVHCAGTCRHQSPEECASALHLVLPYRGVFVRHAGRHANAVAEANQALVFNPAQGYRISHPVGGGDASLSIAVAEPHVRELAPRELVAPGEALALDAHALRLEPRAQAIAASLRHGLVAGVLEPLAAESLALSLIASALHARPRPARAGQQRLVDRAKLVIASDLARRWTLTEIARQVGGSPVYLTQVFQAVEGIPLYRYQRRLRLARALDLLGERTDLAALAFELGFSSHSHFTAAFRSVYRCAPSTFRTRITPRRPATHPREVSCAVTGYSPAGRRRRSAA